jgi:uncharacterized protein involved in outer membrane biogenesis
MKQARARSVRGLWIAGATVATIVIALGICEAAGWPFLAAPMQHWLSDALQRRVSLAADPATRPTIEIHLLGGIDIRAAHIEIGAPHWSQRPYMLRARDAQMKLGYADVWRARNGDPLRVRELRAGALDGQVERLADGRASWQFGARTDEPDTRPPTQIPLFGRLEVESGTLVYRDALVAVDLDARYSLVDQSRVPAAGDPGRVPAPAGAASAPDGGLAFDAHGSYQKQPLRIGLQTAGVLPVIAEDAATLALPVKLDARIGGARIVFDGTATDVLRLSALQGRFTVQGPSLAAFGDPLHVTLPTTPPFRAEGRIAKQGLVWNAVVDRATIGSSRLGGAFTYDPRPARPVLSGRLNGSRLLLADLGPAVGAPAKASPAVPAVAPATAARKPAAKPGHVLPDRAFDLPSLRAMDANVLVDIDNLDLGSSLLEPLRPLRTHLIVDDGVLRLREIDARTGQGRLSGGVQLDGRGAQALWTADLGWSGVRLERWIHQPRGGEAPPYATGSLSGEARMTGQGRSTAAILGSLRGGVRMHLTGATISHLAVEAAGLDIAESLGLLIKGDDTLKVQCSVADLAAEQGVLRPRALVLDTNDSTLWVDGSVSLATEKLDLRVVTTPKDFSPLTLRTPLTLRGTFANPQVSVEKGRLGSRLGASALLALANPLAAFVPLIDAGNSAEAKREADACRMLAQRFAAKPLAAPTPAKANAQRR